MAEEETKKIKSVIELSKYKVGQTVYWVNFHSKDIDLDVPVSDEWIFEAHPKTFFDRGYMQYDGKMPMLHAKDFRFFMEAVSYSVVVEEFTIALVARSKDTGEFLYKNTNDDWMLESLLLPTIRRANTERRRIVQLLKGWARKLK